MVHSLMWLVLLAAGQDSRPCAGELDAKLPRPEMLARVREQLRASGVRAVAWGAYNAGTHGLREVVPELRSVLGILKQHPLTEQKRLVTLAVLDAMVRLEAPLPLEEFAPWFHDADLQAPVLILAARRPKDCAGFLLAVLPKANTDLGAQAICNLLLETDPRGLVQQSLPGIRLRVEVLVHEPDPDPVFLGCGCRFGGGRMTRTWSGPTGFPPTPQYQLLRDGDAEGAVSFAPGPEGVYFVRGEYEKGVPEIIDPASEPSGGRSSRAHYRLRCLLELAGLEDNGVLAPEIRVDHHWNDWLYYLTAVPAELEQVRGCWRNLLARLAAVGLIDRKTALRPPPIEISVRDRRRDKAEALPELPDAPASSR